MSEESKAELIELLETVKELTDELKELGKVIEEMAGVSKRADISRVER